MKLFFVSGVRDIPHSPKKGGGFITTGDVARRLEGGYRLFSQFYEINEAEILNAVADSLFNNCLDILATGKSGLDFRGANSKLTNRMKKWISTSETEETMQQIKPNRPIPTRAALRGVNHRLKRPYGKWKKHAFGKAFIRNARRPSFRDTGKLGAAIIIEIRAE